MSEIGKKPNAVIKDAVSGGMTPGIVTPDEAIAIGNAMVADDGKVDARGAMLMFRHLHDLHSKTEFILEEDRARLSDIAKLGLKQLFEHRENMLFQNPHQVKKSHLSRNYSLPFDSLAITGNIASFAYFHHKSQRYIQVTLDSKHREHSYAVLSLKSGSVVHKLLSVSNLRWYLKDLIPAQKAGIVKYAVQRKKLVAIVDALEKGIYTKGVQRKSPAKLKGYSKKKSKRPDQEKVANKYFKSITKRKPHTVFKVRGITIKVRGEMAPGLRRSITKALKTFHPNELKMMGHLTLNIFDERKLKRFIKSKLDRKARYAYSTSGAFVYRGTPPKVFLSTRWHKHIVTLRHEMGHNLDYIYGGKGLFSTKEFWGIAHHYRTYILPCKDRACLVDRAVNLYAGDARRTYSDIDPEPEWFTENRRLMMNDKGYVGPDSQGFSTVAEFKRKDPVGFLVFTKYRQLLDADHKHPQNAFSMTSFHEARNLVATSGGKITDVLVEKWTNLKLDLQAERHVKKGMSLIKKGKQDRLAAIKEFRKAVALIPEYSYARSQLAKILRLIGRKKEAIKEREILINMDPLVRGGGVTHLIRYYKKHKQDYKLRALYDRLVILHHDIATYHVGKAELMAKSGKAEEAYDHLEKQVKLTGKTDYLIFIAKIADKRKDRGKVSWVFGELRKKERQLTQHCAAGYQHMGKLLYKAKIGEHYKAALWWYGRGVEKYPADLLLNFYYAWTSAVNLKMKGVNKRLFQKAMAYFEKQDAKALYQVTKAHRLNIVPFAQELIKNKQYKHAAVILSKLISVRPRDISLRVGYAKALHGAGQKSAFDKELALISGPGFDEDDQASWLIDVARFTAERGDEAITFSLLDRLAAIDKGWGAAEYAAFYLSRKKEKSALQHLEELRVAIAKGEYKTSPELYDRIGEMLYYSRHGKRYELALLWYAAGIRKHPHNFDLNFMYAWTALINAPAKSVKEDLLNQAMGYLTTLDAKTSLKNHKRIEKFVRQLARNGLKEHVLAFYDNMQPHHRILFIQKAIANSRHYSADATLYRTWLKYEPNSVAAHLGLSRTLGWMGKHRDALKLLDAWKMEYLPHPDISVAKAKLAAKARLSAPLLEAIAELEEMEASRQDITLSAEHYRLIANYYHQTKDDKQMAMAWCVHGTQRYPKDYKLRWLSAQVAIDSRDEQWLQQEIAILNKLDPTRHVYAEYFNTYYWTENGYQVGETKRRLMSVNIHRNSN